MRAVEADVAIAEAQRAELQDLMARTGQGDALLVAPVEAVPSTRTGGYTSTTWVEGRICVLARADVVVMFAQPRVLGAEPTTIWVRWDVVGRVCGADCWNTLPDIEPPRVVTRRWPSNEQLEILANLALEPPPGP